MWDKNQIVGILLLLAWVYVATMVFLGHVK